MVLAMDNFKPEIVSEDGQIERTLIQAFAGPATLHTHAHNTKKFEISILSVYNRPANGLACLGTIGLWRTSLLSHQDSHPARLELFGIFAADKVGCRDMLASAAFRVMRTREHIDPGTVFLDYVHAWYPKATAAHLYFAEPGRLHAIQFDEIRMGNLGVRFLELIPITPSEHDYLLQHGADALEAALLVGAADLTDLKRNSAV